MERFSGQLAVVTGAGGGIPSAITKELLKCNVNVVGLDRSPEKLQALANDVSTNGNIYTGKFYPHTCDISMENEVRETFEWIDAILKPISILVNGAGVLTEKTNDLQNFKTRDFDATFGVNAKGLMLCAKEVLNSMIRNSVAGHIVNICSGAGHDNFYHEGYTIYVASKHAVRVFSDALRREVTKKRANIKITNLSPGLVDTEILRGSPMKVPDSKEEILSPEDVAKGCMTILNTPPNVLISQFTIKPIHSTDRDDLVEEK